MRDKTIQYNNYELLPKIGDRTEYLFFFSIINPDNVDQAGEVSHINEVRIKVGISRPLDNSWHLNQADLVKVLFKYAIDHIRNKLIDNSLRDYEELQRDSYNSPQECPYDPSEIDMSIGPV